jgi:prolyl-tRNA synthetase
LVWPKEIAPALVHLIATGKESKPFEVAENIARELEDHGISVLFDDRREASPGVKFKDSELIGNPIIVIVGKSLSEGKIEIRERKSGNKEEISVDQVTKHISNLLK